MQPTSIYIATGIILLIIIIMFKKMMFLPKIFFRILKNMVIIIGLLVFAFLLLTGFHPENYEWFNYVKRLL